MRTQPQSSVHLRSGTGRDTMIELPSVTIRVKVASATTAGSLAVIEYVAPPHSEGIQPHWHARTTEWLYVVDGTLACTLGDHTITALTGTTIIVPRTVVHTVWNPTATPIRFLSLFMPGGCEAYFEELALLIANSTHWPLVSPIESLALAARHDMLLPERHSSNSCCYHDLSGIVPEDKSVFRKEHKPCENCL